MIPRRCPSHWRLDFTANLAIPVPKRRPLRPRRTDNVYLKTKILVSYDFLEVHAHTLPHY